MILLAIFQITRQSDIIVSWQKQAQESGVQVLNGPAFTYRHRKHAFLVMCQPIKGRAYVAGNADNAPDLLEMFGVQLLQRSSLMRFALALFLILFGSRLGLVLTAAL